MGNEKALRPPSIPMQLFIKKAGKKRASFSEKGLVSYLVRHVDRERAGVFESFFKKAKHTKN